MAVYKDNNNTWYASFRAKTPFGQYVHKTKRGFKNKKEARQYELDFKAKYANCCNFKFTQLVDKYLTYCELRRKVTTIENKKYLIYKHFMPYFENLTIDAITIETLIAWQNIMLRHTPPYSGTYLYTTNNILKSMFNFAEKYCNLTTNPAKLLDTIGKARNNHIDYWTQDEFKRFILALSDKEANKTAGIKRHIDDLPLIVAFTTLFYSGLRLGELLALTPEDLDFINNTLRINKSLVRIGKKNIIQSPKTQTSIRVVPMPSKIMSMLSQYVNKLDGISRNDQIFLMLNKHNMWRALRSGAKLAGIKTIRLHDLRHSNASLLYELNVPIKEISERLGHSSVKITLDVYTHIYQNKQNETVQKLNDII